MTTKNQQTNETNNTSITDTKFFSKVKGELPKGCQACVKGSKIVIFVTGLCSRKCYFCPTSDEKQYKDVVYANERKIMAHNKDSMLAEIIDEAKRQTARGAGLTGGDPLQKMDRTCFIIKGLKKEFGKTFHVHLYTPLDLVTTERLKKLYDAGLDEIRFHPDIETDKQWKKIELAGQFNWDKGVEIPVVPDKIKDTENLLMFLRKQVDFVNLNELEVADNSQSKLVEMGYLCKDNMSYAVKDSESASIGLMNFAIEQDLKFDIHFCSAKLKDAVQLANRILRTGKNIKRPFEKITKEGLLVRGVVYLEELKPDFGYQKTIKGLSDDKKKVFLSKLEELRTKLVKNHRLKESELIVDTTKVRIITSISNAKIIAKKNKDLKCAVTTEYPTSDQIEIEVEFLN